jgi:hypothetical protein
MGKQGVLIPEANVRHLVLRNDVIEAVANGKFHLYPVRTIDQGWRSLPARPPTVARIQRTVEVSVKELPHVSICFHGLTRPVSAASTRFLFVRTMSFDLFAVSNHL